MRIQELLTEKMMPASMFAGSKKNKLGTAGQWKNTGPSKNRAARPGDLVGGAAESVEVDEKTDPKVCRSPKRLGRSDYSSCVSQGLRPHLSKGKGHTDGHGHYLKGHKAKSVKYGGDVKDYDGKP